MCFSTLLILPWGLINRCNLHSSDRSRLQAYSVKTSYAVLQFSFPYPAMGFLRTASRWRTSIRLCYSTKIQDLFVTPSLVYPILSNRLQSKHASYKVEKTFSVYLIDKDYYPIYFKAPLN